MSGENKEDLYDLTNSDERILNLDREERIISMFGGPSHDLSELDKIDDSDIIINPDDLSFESGKDFKRRYVGSTKPI